MKVLISPQDSSIPPRENKMCESVSVWSMQKKFHFNNIIKQKHSFISNPDSFFYVFYNSTKTGEEQSLL